MNARAEGRELRFVFLLWSPSVIGALLCVMMSAAAYEIGAQQERPLRGDLALWSGRSVMALATAAVVAFAFTTHIQPAPWYDPRFLVPLVGIVISIRKGL